MNNSDLEDTSKLYAYCLQDIASQSEITTRLPELSPFEHRLWILDQQINARGVYIDVDSLKACIGIVEQAHVKYNAELREITEGAVPESSKLQDMKRWMDLEGFHLPNMQSATIDEAIECETIRLFPEVKRALEIRQVLGGAAVKKLFSIANRLTTDNRLHGLFAFCGASRTGRWAGRGPQPQNLYRDCHSPEVLETVLEAIKGYSFDRLVTEFGDPIETVAGCLRGLFCSAPGHELICSDYSAIEAVVLAELAGETWRQELFQQKGDIYSESAAQITGVPMPAEGPHPHRKTIGKVAELASGYQGWIGAWKNFGAEKHFNSDDEIKQAILKWRAASPNIVEMWGGQLREDPKKPWDTRFTPEFFGVEGAAVSAIANPGHRYTYRLLTYYVADDVLYCELPSGRKLAYHNPQLEPGTDNYSKRAIWKISYMGYSDGQWKRLYTYGGKLTENATQAVARDILAYAMLALDMAGYPIVLHVHDEVVSEVPKGTGSVEEFERIMSKMPPWAANWPVRATGGWIGLRYRKE